MNIGFVGAGKIAQALAKGFIASGLTKGEAIIASCDPADSHFMRDFESLGAEITTDNTLVPQRSEVVILAVKPHIIPSVLQDIHPFVGDKNLILSVAMGIPLRDIEKGLPTGTRVVRIMPNTPAVVRSAASVYVCGNATKSKDEAVTEKLLRAIGTCDKVAESMMDAITALSGAGPAYAYIMVEALADGGVKMGLPRDLSYRLAAQTVLGAGQMIRDTRIHPGQLKDDVTSPGGTHHNMLISIIF
uniref:Pyrroline-5-carboxylate reductase n=1 Tax=Timema monikensis TaxID=170555 RepID=A0A7R9DZ64_9NEOP|nr:unnamed protein product [Timema monikensis]